MPLPCPSWQIVQPNSFSGWGLESVRNKSSRGCVVKDDRNHGESSSYGRFAPSALVVADSSSTAFHVVGSDPASARSRRPTRDPPARPGPGQHVMNRHVLAVADDAGRRRAPSRRPPERSVALGRGLSSGVAIFTIRFALRFRQRRKGRLRSVPAAVVEMAWWQVLQRSNRAACEKL